jgi:alkylation response protein AidB-like acyl-CoA dehydrogenase
MMIKTGQAIGLPDDEYQLLRKQIIEGIWSELDPLEQQIEDEERIPNETVLPILSRIGAFGLLVPREYGGYGLSMRQYLPILAEFAKIQGGIRVIVHVHNSFAHALSEIGNKEQCAEVLPGAVSSLRADGTRSRHWQRPRLESRT